MKYAFVQNIRFENIYFQSIITFSAVWQPALGVETSICVREDIMGALYMHHLLGPPLLQHLPPYFLRQLVTRLKRIVIFPGKILLKLLLITLT